MAKNYNISISLFYFFKPFASVARNPVYGMVHIKEPLLLIEKSSPCGGSGIPLSPLPYV